MPHLYLSVPADDATATIANLLAQRMHVESFALGSFRIIHVLDPDDDLVRQTIVRIGTRQLASAVLALNALPRDRLFFAIEWHRRMLIDKALSSDAALRYGELRRTDMEPDDYVVFEIARKSDDETESPGSAWHDAREVRQNLQRYYGRFAEESTGGAHALFAAGVEAAARAERHSSVFVAPPERFGFDVDDDESSVVSLCRRRIISASAYGFGLSNWRQAMEYLDFDPPENQEELIGQWSMKGIDFGLAIVLRGLEDPPVVIPMGAVFQQPAPGMQQQNLAVAATHSVIVNAGQTVPMVLPAWCLNRSFAPPSGVMSPTPLVAKVSGTQTAVWDAIANNYRSIR